MSYAKAMRERNRAREACRRARGDVHAGVDGVMGVYQAHPVPALAGAAGMGFVLARLSVGTGLIRTGMRIASGPAWQLVRQYVTI